MTTDSRISRAGIDGRFIFGAVVLFSGTGLLALMDRIGVPADLVQALAVLFVLAGLATIAALLRTMRVSSFYAAGRAVPAPYAGLAMAGLGAALFLPFVPPLPAGLSLSEIFAGFACGMACAALVSGPLLRKTGAFSIPDLIAARFPKLSARLGAILITAAVSILLALAGYQEAVSTLVRISGFRPSAAAATIAALLLFITLPGGLAGTLWAAATAVVIAMTAFSLPLLITGLQGTPLAFPFIGHADQWAKALIRIESWTGAADAKEHMNPALIGVIALGLGVLAPLLSPSIACQDRRRAQQAGFAALFWGGLLILLAVATMAQASLTLDRMMIGQTPGGLPSELYQASSAGDLMICGAAVSDSGSANRACAASPDFTVYLEIQNIATKGKYLLTNLAKLSGFGSAFSGLISAAVLGIGLTLAAFGVQSSSAILGNDMFYRVRDHAALTSRRLAITRVFAIAIVVLCGTATALFRLDPQTLIGFAIFLSAAALVPLLALALWPRATSFDATVALLAGLFTAEMLIAGLPLTSSIDRFAASALLASGCGLCAGLLTSLIRRRANPDGGTFTKAIFSQSGEWLHPDKGA